MINREGEGRRRQREGEGKRRNGERGECGMRKSEREG